MKKLLLMLFVGPFFVGSFLDATSLSAEDYVLTINGTAQEIGLDKETQLTLPDGTSLKLVLRQKEYLSFQGDLFSFEHKNKYKPNRNDLGDGIFQTMTLTPLGTGVLIQEYTQMNPSTLVDTMVHELTKEEVEYGFKFETKEIKREADGVTFTGKQAVTTNPGEEWTRIVLTCAKKDRGLLVISFIEKDNYETEKGLIEQFWKTLKVDAKLK